MGYGTRAVDLRGAEAEAYALRSAVRREVGAFARLLDEEKRTRLAGTLHGRALDVIGDIFSIYCVIKVGMATRSILRHGARRTGVDPVTRAIDYALRLRCAWRCANMQSVGPITAR